jgi:DMSO/TMAO reductase YedYZ molybdopterin-dependent catalytic subunit
MGVVKRATPRWPAGLLAGAVAAGVALGVGQLVAGLVATGGSPVVEVGQLEIDLTPAWLRDVAIREFGSHEKTVLVGGIVAVTVALAAGLGVLAVRRLAVGLAGFTALASVGLVAALTRPTLTAVDVLPTLVAVLAAGSTLWALVKLAEPPAGTQTSAGGSEPPVAEGSPGDGAEPWWCSPAAHPTAGGPGSNAAVNRHMPPLAARGASAPGMDRRRFLAASVSAAGAAAVSGLAGRFLAERFDVDAARAALQLPPPARPAPALPPGADLHIPGLAPFVTPNRSFYRVDTALVLPEIEPRSWQLRVHGMVDREVTVSFRDLLRRQLLEDYITLCCVSNPVGGPYIGNALWLGASLASLLREAGIRAGADQLLCTSVDGFTSGTPVHTVMDGRDALLAVAMNGSPLPIAHGFPVRMVVPGLYGYVSATKWLTDIKVTSYQAEAGYWVQRGWAAQAPIKTESRIDVPTGQRQLSPGRTPVAGVAWAQHKGIEAVEVRVDRGTWQPARLAAVPDIDTWRQWVWDWDARPGRHLIEARATDRTGYTQTARQALPVPNGASGYPSVQVSVGPA